MHLILHPYVAYRNGKYLIVRDRLLVAKFFVIYSCGHKGCNRVVWSSIVVAILQFTF